MRVALVRPPIEFVQRCNSGFIPSRLYAQWLTRYPPLALLYYASILERAGHEVVLVDAEMLDYSIEDVVRALSPFRPGLVVVNVNVFHPWVDLGNLETLKRALGAPVVARGHFPNLYPEEVARQPFVDAVIATKGFQTIAALARAVEAGEPLGDVAGLVFREGGGEAGEGRLVRTGDEPPLLDMDSLPHPARHLLQNDLYMTNLTVRGRFTTAFSSLGCPYSCFYCSDRGVRYVARSPVNVVDEIEQCVHDLGIGEICYLDPTFTARRDRTIEICRGILGRGLKINWTMRTRPDLVDEELVRTMARAGCVRMSLGIESGDPGILDRAGRKMGLDAIRRAVHAAHRSGVMVFGYFILGNDGETEETIRRTIRFSRELPLNFAQFMRVIPMPATGVLERAKEKQGVDIWLEVYRRRRLDLDLMTPPATELSGEELNRWIARAYLRFYLSPRLVARNLSLRFTPYYVLRQLKIFALLLRLNVTRGLRRLGLAEVPAITPCAAPRSRARPLPSGA